MVKSAEGFAAFYSENITDMHEVGEYMPDDDDLEMSGSRRDISPDVIYLLNQGEIESATLMEWLAVDQKRLLLHILNYYDRFDYLAEIQNTLSMLGVNTPLRLNSAIAQALFFAIENHQDKEFFKILSRHRSDTVRCWASFVAISDPNLLLPQRLEAIYPFAADHHFIVREAAWLAMRPFIIAQLNRSLDLLLDWSKDKNANIRRFCSEVTRPRGVWCPHIPKLKQQPEMALPLLEALREDSAKYVQISVGNWLNDASKSRPDFVSKLCIEWLAEAHPATEYIVRRAMRTLKKHQQKIHKQNLG